MMNLETLCSYNCPKCALTNRRENVGPPLSLEERRKVIKEAVKAGVRAFTVIGNGEPTEHFDLMKGVIEAVNNEGLVTILFTNLSHLDRQQAEFYRDHNVSIFVSLDAAERKKYRMLTGVGDLNNVLQKIELLRSVYRGTEEMKGDCRVVRIGMNVTLINDNIDELQKLRELAGDDMQFVVNAPMKRGTFSNQKVWDSLVGNNIVELERIAEEFSDTGGHSSIIDGVCGYFRRGISVDTDGKLMTCGYASETAEVLGDVRDLIKENKLLSYYREMRKKFQTFMELTGEGPSCPLRSEQYDEFVRIMGKR
jgi:MoaA/NifB/PqqE/SkfB family radical SAM enzyme